MRSNYLYCLFITALLTGCGGFHGSAQAPVEERGEAISKSVPAPPSVAPTPVIPKTPNATAIPSAGMPNVSPAATSDQLMGNFVAGKAQAAETVSNVTPTTRNVVTISILR